jgi:hypothetical protein
VALQASIKGMQRALGALRQTGTLAAASDDIAPWTERQRIVRKPAYDALESHYSAGSAEAPAS